MKEHKYAKVLRWIADGESVEVKCIGVFGDEAWKPIKETMSPDCWKEAIDETDGYEFRIKPKTVKIGNREIESPLSTLKKFDKFYHVLSNGCATDCTFENIAWQVAMLRDGRLFATQEAALAAHEAITVLLTGKQ